MYTETKKFSNSSRIRIFIIEIHVEISTNLIRFFFAVNPITILSNTKYCKISFVWSAVPVIKCFPKGQNVNVSTFSMCFGDGSAQFRWTLTYQRQFLDVIQSGFAVKKSPVLMWFERNFPPVELVFFFCLPEFGRSPANFVCTKRLIMVFGRQLFYEYQNEKQHYKCWNQLPPCLSLRCVRLW